VALGEFKRLQEARSPAFRLVIHHGQVVLGGRASLGEESLSGKEVNFVFRMEKLAGQLRLARLVSEPARRLLADALVTTAAGAHALPGFPEASPFATF
jgi:class 3 adenylate cyclase